MATPYACPWRPDQRVQIHGLTNRDGFLNGTGWTKTFTDPRLCAAIVDRLTFNGAIIETGTDSYRLATTRARTEQSTKAG